MLRCRLMVPKNSINTIALIIQLLVSDNAYDAYNNTDEL